MKTTKGKGAGVAVAAGRWRRSLRELAFAALAMAVGSVAMIGVGKLYGLIAGGPCTLLCRTHVSAAYGAGVGLFVAILQKFD